MWSYMILLDMEIKEIASSKEEENNFINNKIRH